MKKSQKLQTVPAIIWVITLVAIGAIWLLHSATVKEAPSEIDALPSIMDVQRKLCEMGYDIAVDGVLGPETQRAWEAAETGLYCYWAPPENKETSPGAEYVPGRSKNQSGID